MARYRVIQIQQAMDWFEAEADSEADALRLARTADHEDRRWHFDATHELIREYVELDEGQDVRPPDTFNHYNHCQRKSAYPTEAVCLVYIRRREEAVEGLELEAYECKLCNMWHMAKKRADGSRPDDMALAGARS